MHKKKKKKYPGKRFHFYELMILTLECFYRILFYVIDLMKFHNNSSVRFSSVNIGLSPTCATVHDELSGSIMSISKTDDSRIKAIDPCMHSIPCIITMRMVVLLENPSAIVTSYTRFSVPD